MTKREIANIASKMDESTKLLIDKEVAERLEILKEGDVSEDELSEMEECLYASLVLQELLNGEYELLEEERQALFDEMEEMYNRYSDLLVRARIEEKIGKKKRMTLQLMKIREDLMLRKQEYKDVKQKMKDNREEHKKLNDLTKKSALKELARKDKDAYKGVGGIGLPRDNRAQDGSKGSTKSNKNNPYKTLLEERADTINKILNDLKFKRLTDRLASLNKGDSSELQESQRAAFRDIIEGKIDEGKDEIKFDLGNVRATTPPRKP